MTDKEIIRGQANIDISNLRMAQEQGIITEFGKGKLEALEGIVDFIDSMQEEPVSEELEKAAIEAFKQIVDTDKNNFLEIFKAGAKWKDEQMIKDAIEAELDDVCGFLTISVPYHNGIAGDKVKVIVIKED